MKSKLKKIMILLLSCLTGLFAVACIYLQHPKFGQSSSGERLERIKNSPNYKDGKFHNQTPTPTFAEGYSFWGEIKKQITQKRPGRYPVDTIPFIKSDLLHIPLEEDVLVWFGHSSYFIQVNGVKFLIDPVLSGKISPVSGSDKSFKGANEYAVSDLPPIDYLIISHDHYDHLDYETVKDLQKKTSYVICGLGVGAHFEYWGYKKEQLYELDWWDSLTIKNNNVVYALPARHKSGRTLKQNATLWASYLIKKGDKKIYFSGDSGYDLHFKQIGDKFGSVDLALLENGQYDSAWHYVHMLPEETIQAALDLNARRLIPIHNSKFVLANHTWDDPVKKVAALSKTKNVRLLTPRIGEVFHLNDSTQAFAEWWEDIN